MTLLSSWPSYSNVIKENIIIIVDVHESDDVPHRNFCEFTVIVKYLGLLFAHILATSCVGRDNLYYVTGMGNSI